MPCLYYIIPPDDLSGTSARGTSEYQTPQECLHCFENEALTIDKSGHGICKVICPRTSKTCFLAKTEIFSLCYETDSFMPNITSFQKWVLLGAWGLSKIQERCKKAYFLLRKSLQATIGCFEQCITRTISGYSELPTWNRKIERVEKAFYADSDAAVRAFLNFYEGSQKIIEALDSTSWAYWLDIASHETGERFYSFPTNMANAEWHRCNECSCLDCLSQLKPLQRTQKACAKRTRLQAKLEQSKTGWDIALCFAKSEKYPTNKYFELLTSFLGQKMPPTHELSLATLIHARSLSKLTLLQHDIRGVALRNRQEIDLLVEANLNPVERADALKHLFDRRETTRQAAETFLQICKNIESLGDILVSIQSDAREYKPNICPHKIHPVIVSILNEFENSFHEIGIRAKVHECYDWVLIDYKLFRVVLRQLLENAKKYVINYVQASPQLSPRQANRFKDISIEFNKTGKNIDMAISMESYVITDLEKEAIFTRGFRGREAKRMQSKHGMGYGLHQTKHFMQLMNGEIFVVPNSDGQGTFLFQRLGINYQWNTFHLMLPLAPCSKSNL